MGVQGFSRALEGIRPRQREEDAGQDENTHCEALLRQALRTFEKLRHSRAPRHTSFLCRAAARRCCSGNLRRVGERVASRVSVLGRAPIPSGVAFSLVYWPRCTKASRSGALGIRISPSNGRSSSRIRKIAPETDSTQTKRTARTVELGGAKSPKLTNIMASQKISTAKTTMGIELPLLCSTSNQRVCLRLRVMVKA